MADQESQGEQAQETEPESTRSKLRSGLRRAAGAAKQVSGKALRKGAEVGKQAAQVAGQAAQDTVGKVQRRLGEDYYAILDANPIVLNTMSRVHLLADNSQLLSTAYNIPWTTTLLWSAAAGSVLSLRGSVAGAVEQLFHEGPGHIQHWDEINKFMDGWIKTGSGYTQMVDSAGKAIAGSAHRLKWGHSVDALPQIVERFGIEGVPAYFTHLLQDFTTTDGIPVVPNAWDLKQWLEGVGLQQYKEALTGLVSISFTSLLSAMAVVTLVTHLWNLGDAAVKKIRVKNYLKTAAIATTNRDYNAAKANYQRALEIERAPAALMALGQVYMQRASTRMRAHQAFTEAMTLLAAEPACVVPYGSAKLSLRGLAALQALSTADVLADIHPEHWSDYIQDTVNAAVFSFRAAASKQGQQGENFVPDVIVTPANCSAAINYYLAAKSASYYPLAEDRHGVVTGSLRSAIQSLGRMAQYDEAQLREPADTLGKLWAWELLPPDEVQVELATYIL